MRALNLTAIVSCSLSAFILSACGPASNFMPASSTGDISGAPGASGAQIERSAKTQSAGLWDRSVTQGTEWTQYTLNALDSDGKSLIAANPSDMNKFCPAYSGLSDSDKAQVWVRIISAMAYQESGFRTGASHIESFTADRQKSTSVGLLQLSMASGNEYGCHFESNDDVRNAEKNIHCAVLILAHWVPSDGRLAGSDSGGWKGGARYWGVLRSNNATQLIMRHTKALPLCN